MTYPFGNLDETKFILAVASIIIVLLISVIFQKLFLEVKRIQNKKLLLSSNILEIDRMDGFQFEKYLKVLFEKQGFKVEKTKNRSDYGADLVMKNGSKKIVVQAKRYTKAVGIKAVQEVIGAVAYYQAQEAWVVTNSTYTKSAVDLAKKSGVKLIDRTQLMTFVSSVDSEKASLNTIDRSKRTVEVAKGHKCKKCNAQMVVRHSEKGSFYGCSQFPRCRYTKPIRKKGVAL